MAEKRERYQNRIELLQGTLDLLILQTLQWGPQHGYGISVAIRNRSGELLQVDTGSLYPALHRLEISTDGGRKETTHKRTLKVVAALGRDRGRAEPRAEMIGKKARKRRGGP